MNTFVYKLSDKASIINRLFLAFWGNYRTSNPEIQSLLKDIFINNIGPGNFHIDKINMSNDMYNISNDLKIAFKEYKERNNG